MIETPIHFTQSAIFDELFLRQEAMVIREGLTRFVKTKGMYLKVEDDFLCDDNVVIMKFRIILYAF